MPDTPGLGVEFDEEAARQHLRPNSELLRLRPASGTKSGATIVTGADASDAVGTMSGLFAWIAYLTFAVVLFLGWDELGVSRAVFLFLLLAAYVAQSFVPYGPALFAPFVAMLDIALVFVVFKGDVTLR